MATQSVPWMRETEVFNSGAEGYHMFAIPSLAITPDGTILAFCEGRKHGPAGHQAMYGVLKRSTDNGVTWGDLQPLYVRNAQRRVLKRLCAWSDDGGESWSDLIELDDLPDPICQASIVRFTDETSHDKNRIVFGNLNSATRDNLTLRVSYDECKTWAASKVLYTGPAGYSDMAVAPDMTLCCLYEMGVESPYETIRLAQFNLEWLTGGADRIEG
jgi:hypothetical protein